MLLRLFLLSALLSTAKGGNCWSVMGKNGRCTELLEEKVSKESCCGTSNSVATAYSSEDLDPGTLFFWRILGGGIPCSPCKESCLGVACGEGKKCVVRNGQAKCVCAPECRGKAKHLKGPVCATDGRSYTSLCRLRKRACRTNNPSLNLAYYGLCQSSCDKIKCPRGKYCVLDQNLGAHCVRCSKRCGGGSSKLVCGADGVTYESPCHLRQAACHLGRAIPLAYRGPCIKSASCSKIQCKEREACLSEPKSGSPRCVTCSYRCPKPNLVTRPICATNNRTYQSWCHMLKDACATGFVIETKFTGSCQSLGKSQTSIKNTVLEDVNVLL